MGPHRIHDCHEHSLDCTHPHLMHAFVANHFRVNAGKNTYTKVLIPSLFPKLECQNGPLTFLPRKKDATLAKLCRGPKNIKLTNLLWDLAGKPTPITFITSHKLGHFYYYYYLRVLFCTQLLITRKGQNADDQTWEVWIMVVMIYNDEFDYRCMLCTPFMILYLIWKCKYLELLP